MDERSTTSSSSHHLDSLGAMDFSFEFLKVTIQGISCIGILYLRNGDFVRYTGDLMDEFEILDWVVDRQTLEIPGRTNSYLFLMKK